MKYKPELGLVGNLKRTIAELTKTNNKVFNNKAEVDAVQHDTDALLVDQEFRLTLLELGLTE